MSMKALCHNTNLIKFLISFSAQVRTIFLGLPLQ